MFISLHDPNDAVMLVNVAHITCLRGNPRGGTDIWLVADADEALSVRESFDDVRAAIEAALRR